MNYLVFEKNAENLQLSCYYYQSKRIIIMKQQLRRSLTE